jgi:hypothetical protein
MARRRFGEPIILLRIIWKGLGSRLRKFPLRRRRCCPAKARPCRQPLQRAPTPHRQLELVNIVEGRIRRSNKQIARSVGISERSVANRYSRTEALGETDLKALLIKHLFYKIFT